MVTVAVPSLITHACCPGRVPACMMVPVRAVSGSDPDRAQSAGGGPSGRSRSSSAPWLTGSIAVTPL